MAVDNTDTVTALQAAYPQPTPVIEGAGASSATETPLGSKPGNFLGAEAKPLQARAAANEKIATGVKEQGENKINRALIDQDAAVAEEAQQGNDVDQLQSLSDQHNAEIQKELARAKPMIEAADKFQFHQYWSDKGTGDRVLAAISSALLGFGTGQYHNVAMDIAKQDHERQVAELNGLMERAKMAGANVDRLREIHHNALQSMTLMQAAKHKAIAAQYARMGAGAATVEAKTAAQMGEALQMKAAADEMENFYKGLRTKAAHNVSKRINQPQGRRPGD